MKLKFWIFKFESFILPTLLFPSYVLVLVPTFISRETIAGGGIWWVGYQFYLIGDNIIKYNYTRKSASENMIRKKVLERQLFIQPIHQICWQNQQSFLMSYIEVVVEIKYLNFDNVQPLSINLQNLSKFIYRVNTWTTTWNI